MGSVTMYLHCGKHMTGITGSAAHMASTLADAAANTPRMHHHTIIATDCVHHLAAEEFAWRPMLGGHELVELAARQQQGRTAPVLPECHASLRVDTSSQALIGSRNIQAVKHLLPHGVDHAQEVVSRIGTPELLQKLSFEL